MKPGKPFSLSDFVDRVLPVHFFLSIRTRVILSYLVIIGLGLITIARQVTENVRPRYLEVMEETMVDMVQVMASVLEPTYHEGRLDPTLVREAFGKAGSRQFSARIYEITKESLAVRLIVTDATGRVIFDSHREKEGLDLSQYNDIYLTLQGKYGARSTRMEKGDPNSSIIHVAAPIFHENKIVGVASLSKPVTSIATFMERARDRILFLAGVAALGAIVLGFLLSEWLTYPIRNLITYAKSIRDGRRTPLPNLGHSEVRTLGLAFEEMRDAIEGKDYVHRYVQSLTHEMKSPVAAIQGAAELLEEEMPPEERRRFLANIRTETARLQEGIDSLLLLASVESKKVLDHVTPVDLTQMLAQAHERVAARAALRSISLTLALPPPPAMTMGDPFLLERATLNLLENALAFTPPCGTISLSLAEQMEPIEQAGTWAIIIDDSGPGIPAYALPRVCERFFSLPRPDTGKKSSGLGLPFVQEVAVLHGGTVALQPRPETTGTTGTRAILTLPRHAE